MAASLTMTAITGMFFGLAPAARAARMNPVDALRYE
jgi:ABC-type antimicrobial peptide transport system permease subunit